MKKNLPVTNVEQPYPKGQYLVSKTDLKGALIYANDVFIKLSGFTWEELKGQNHNIVRHPDMPPQAFEDLWRTVKSGYPWKGLVKNRCKNGDYYWVEAFVVPIRKDDKIVGYMSVRSEPSRQAVAQAESLYKQLNASGAKLNTTPPLNKRISMKARLGALLASTLLILGSVALLSSQGLKQSDQALADAYEKHMTPSLAVGKMIDRIADNRAQLMLALQHNPANPLSKLHDHPLQMHLDAIDKNRQLNAELIKQYEQGTAGAEPLPAAKDFFAARDRLRSEGTSPSIEALQKGDYEKAQLLLLTKVNPLFKEVSNHAEALEQQMSERGKKAYQTAQERSNHIVNLNITACIIGALIVALGGWLLLRSLSGKMQRIVHHFSRMGQGNLADEVDITHRDEAGKALTELAAMQVSLKVMLDEIRAASQSIEQDAHKVEWQTANVVDQSEQQRERAASVAAATEEFAQSVRGVAESANEAAEAATEAQTQVSSAQDSMNQSMAATGRVVEAVQHSSETIQELNQAIAKIGDITKVIREIADQTNLLALNAAIEAARAGEAGRGFAVVADEVRKLAERTATSTSDISNNVAEIRQVTDTAVSSMEAAVKEVEEGITLIRESGAGLNRITESSRHVTGMSRDIASAANEQAMASETVAHNMERVAELVDNNMEAASQAKNAVDSLVKSAGYLNRIIGRFKISN
ncbi:methyl-accepting chemotaxis protein [Azonexus sp. IMCC34839]|uniref:methyl-accepting chemotaxis protein n=1 Tax=Azonexus sp. IMCC34839 TaxID=3133695 RepID=UPI00399B5E88